MDALPSCRTRSSETGAGFSRTLSSAPGAIAAASRQEVLTAVTATRHRECLTRNHIDNANPATAAARLNHRSPVIPKDRTKATQAHTVEGSNARASWMASDTEPL